MSQGQFEHLRRVTSDSRTLRFGLAVAIALNDAAGSSAVARRVRALTLDLARLSPAERLRLVAAAVGTAAVTNLALRWLPKSPELLGVSAALPALVAVAALVTAIGAKALARAWPDSRAIDWLRRKARVGSIPS
jgi:hypothetical protein